MTLVGFFFFLRFYLFIFRERERKREREGEKHQCVVASCVLRTGDLAHNPGLCPDRQPFGSQAHAQPSELYQLGLMPLVDNINNFYLNYLLTIYFAEHFTCIILFTLTATT